MTGDKPFSTRPGRRRFFFLAALFALPLLACASFYSAPRPYDDDFTTVGFLDNNVLQVIVRAQPDAGAKGLVARRDSAKGRADSNFADLAAESIADFRSGLCKSSSPASRQFLVKSAAELLEYGTRVREYFGEDESVVIIYRLSRNNIRGLVEGLACEPDAGTGSGNDQKGGTK